MDTSCAADPDVMLFSLIKSWFSEPVAQEVHVGQQGSLRLEIWATGDNRVDLPFSLDRFQTIHAPVIMGRTADPDRWEVLLPLMLPPTDTSERWVGVLGEFLAGEGFEVELTDFL